MITLDNSRSKVNEASLEEEIDSKPKAYKDLMSSYNKQQKNSINKKKPAVWRKEAVWGIEPEFIHDKNVKKINFK